MAKSTSWVLGYYVGRGLMVTAIFTGWCLVGAVLRRKTMRSQVSTSPDGQPRERQPREEMKRELMECESVLAMCVKGKKPYCSAAEPHHRSSAGMECAVRQHPDADRQRK